MKTSTAQSLYRIDRTALKILNISVYAMFILGVIAGLHALLCYFGLRLCTYPFWDTLLLLYKYAWIVCGSITGACVICRIILSPFVKSEEQEAFENKIEYVLQQREAEKQTEKPSYSPLCDLTEEQQKQVQQLLHDLPANPNKPNQIKMVEARMMVKAFLTKCLVLSHKWSISALNCGT